MGKIPVGVELYSVKDALSKDLEGTLTAIKNYGYEVVEFAGNPQYDAQRTAKALKDIGLKCSSWHVPFDSLSDDKIDSTIEFHAAVGNQFLIVPWIPHEQMQDLESLKKLCEKLDKISEKLKKNNMFTGYHNHSDEFQTIKGGNSSVWSALRENTNKDFVMQIDTGNALKGDAKLNEEIAAAAGRSQIIHLKPYSLTNGYATMIGDADDIIDYKFIFDFAKTKGDTKYFIVEYECIEKYGELEGVKLCIDAIRAKFDNLL